MSLPSRGAWIEIVPCRVYRSSDRVAPLAGSVDRNRHKLPTTIRLGVAPLAGSVDRNCAFATYLTSSPGRSPRGERG